MVATTDPARRVPDSPTASAATNICLSLTTVKPTPKQPEPLYITHPEHENYASRVTVCQFLPTRKWNSTFNRTQPSCVQNFQFLTEYSNKIKRPPTSWFPMHSAKTVSYGPKIGYSDTETEYKKSQMNE